MRYRVHPTSGQFEAESIYEQDALVPIQRELEFLSKEVANIKSQGLFDLNQKILDLTGKLDAVGDPVTLRANDDFLYLNKFRDDGEWWAEWSQNKISCGFAWNATDKIYVLAGKFNIHGVGILTIGQTLLTFTGSEVWVYVEVARSNKAVAVKIKNTQPADDAINIEYPLYKFDLVATGKYKLTQVLNWGDPVMNPTLDGYSLSIQSAGTTNMEITGWASQTEGEWGSGTHLLGRNGSYGTVYLSVSDIAIGLITSSGSGGAGWIGSDAPWYSDPPPHSVLSDIVIGTCGDHHVDTTRGGTGTNASYLLLTGAEVRNAFGAGSGMGDHDGNLAISPNLRTLNQVYSGTAARIDWSDTGNQTDATTKTAGGVIISSGLAVTKTIVGNALKIIDGGGTYTNEMSATTFKACPTGAAELSPSGDVDLAPGNNLHLTIPAPRTIVVNGANGGDVTDAFTKGIFTGTGTWSLKAAGAIDPATDYVLVKTV